MKKDSFKLIIMSVAVICIVIAGIMVPGIVLEANQKSEHDHVAKVPKSYLPSGSVMAKEASANLKLSEKLSLIDGQWDSTTDDESQAETDLSAYKGYFDYSGIDFSKLNLISETTAVEQKNNESYEVLQFLHENEYVYAVHEK